MTITRNIKRAKRPRMSRLEIHRKRLAIERNVRKDALKKGTITKKQYRMLERIAKEKEKLKQPKHGYVRAGRKV